jgi:Family of unknown function (DUF6309)
VKWIRKATFIEVLRHFEQHHPIGDDNTNSHARMCLEKATKRVQGKWAYVSLGAEDARNIVLPHHLSEGGHLPLIPPTGMTVRAAANRIRRISASVYAVENPVCWKKLDYWRGRHESALFLSTVAVDHADYHRVKVPRDGLVHLDGLHRLLAWELWRRFGSSRHPVYAYVAGLARKTNNLRRTGP